MSQPKKGARGIVTRRECSYSGQIAEFVRVAGGKGTGLRYTLELVDGKQIVEVYFDEFVVGDFKRTEEG